MHPSLATSARGAVPLHAVTAKEAKAWLAKQPGSRLLAASGFSGAAGSLAALPDAKGDVAQWVLGLGDSRDAFALAAASSLPAGLYRLGEVPDFCGGAQGALAWLMGTYAFDRYKKKTAKAARLVVPAGVDGEEASRIAENLFLARDLINTPANDMGPAELEAAVRALAKKNGAKIAVTSGAALAKNYPLIAAVGG